MEDFIDAPVKTYSSGMYMRLGFAVAVNVNPDILLVDEVLAVGDEGFSLKCLDKFAEFKRRGKTILLVTHGLSMVERFCDEALWLESGENRTTGDPKRVVQMYLTDVERAEDKLLAAVDARAHEAQGPGPSPAPAPAQNADESTAGQEPPPVDEPTAEPAPEESTDTEEAEAVPPRPEGEQAEVDDETGLVNMFTADEGRWGSGVVRIEEVTLEGDQGPTHVFHTGDRMTIRMKIQAAQPVEDFAFGISIFGTDGICCFGTNTDIEEMESKSLEGAGEVEFAIAHLDLVEGTYKLDVAAHKRDGFSYDYHRLLYTFRVKSRTKDVGIYRPRHVWRFTDNVRFKPVSSETTDGTEAVETQTAGAADAE
jgi:hypothetical protein